MSDLHNDLRERIAAALGWTERAVGPDAKGEYGGGTVLVPPSFSDQDFIEALPRTGFVPRAYFCRRWPTEYAESMELLQHMCAAGLHVLFEYSISRNVNVAVLIKENQAGTWQSLLPSGWLAYPPAFKILFTGYFPTLPLAICHAWLAWVEARAKIEEVSHV